MTWTEEHARDVGATLAWIRFTKALLFYCMIVLRSMFRNFLLANTHNEGEVPSKEIPLSLAREINSSGANDHTANSLYEVATFYSCEREKALAQSKIKKHTAQRRNEKTTLPIHTNTHTQTVSSNTSIHIQQLLALSETHQTTTASFRVFGIILTQFFCSNHNQK